MIWRSCSLPEDEAGVLATIESTVLSLQILGKYRGVETDADVVMIHVRSDLGAAVASSNLKEKLNAKVICHPGPELEGQAIAYGLALGCQHRDPGRAPWALPRDGRPESTLVIARLDIEMVLLSFLVTAWFIDHDGMRIPGKVTIRGSVLGLLLGTLAPDARWDWHVSETPFAGFEAGLAGMLLGAGLAFLAKGVARSYGFARPPSLDNVGLLAMVGAFLGWELLLGVVLLDLGLFLVRQLVRQRINSTGRMVSIGSDLSLASIVVILLCACLSS